jgi:hypothetical protein
MDYFNNIMIMINYSINILILMINCMDYIKNIIIMKIYTKNVIIIMENIIHLNNIMQMFVNIIFIKIKINYNKYKNINYIYIPYRNIYYILLL